MEGERVGIETEEWGAGRGESGDRHGGVGREGECG